MTDMETGYKVFKKSVLLDLDLRENSFGIEPEITIKLAKKTQVLRSSSILCRKIV